MKGGTLVSFVPIVISENGYRIITSIVFVSRKKLLKQEQDTITIDQARNMLMSYVDNSDFDDRLYEFAQGLCNSAIEDIETKHTIIDADGDICTDDGRYIATDYVGFIEPLADFIAHIKDNKDYVNEKAETLNQYWSDLYLSEAIDQVINYFDGNSADYILSYTDITADTPIGNYCV